MGVLIFRRFRSCIGLFSLLTLGATSCSTVAMTVNSVPEGADIYLVTDNDRQKLGVTPAEVDPKALGSHSNYHLLISKPGFAPQSFLFESRRVSSKGRIFAELQKDIAQEQGGESTRFNEEVDQVARKVAMIQASLLKHDFGQAEIFAKELLSERPKLGVAWSLLANTFYLQKRNSEALSSYEKALEYDPENRETQLMIQKIKKRGVANE